MSFRELANNMRVLELPEVMPFQTILTGFFNMYEKTLGDDDLMGLTFSMDGGPERQEVTLGSQGQDFLTLEFTKLTAEAKDPVPGDTLIDMLDCEFNSQYFILELLLWLGISGKFFNPVLDGTIQTCVWTADDNSCSIVLFWETNKEILRQDLERITPLF